MSLATTQTLFSLEAEEDIYFRLKKAHGGLLQKAEQKAPQETGSTPAFGNTGRGGSYQERPDPQEIRTRTTAHTATHLNY